MGDTGRRKGDHLAICLDQQVESGAPHGLDRWRLAYRSLPEVSLEDVDLSVELFGRRLAAPLIIGAMTGGTDEAAAINRTLAEAAQARSIGLALGSARIVLEQPETAKTFRVRDVAPDVLLFANLGAVQLNYGVTGTQAAGLVAALEADALNLHLNPLQEAIQPAGDTDFRGLFDRIAEALPHIPVPVVVKEVGAGIGPESAAALAALPLAGVETAGVGGTSWSRVEALRQDDPVAWSAGVALGGYGVPTADSIIACRDAFPDRVVIGSGGLRTALDMATALALGADAVACALPYLKAAQEGVEAVVDVIDHLIHTLKVIHFTCGVTRPGDLRGCVHRVDD